MPQTVITEVPEPFYEGQLVESGSPARKIPALAVEAIRFGLLVVNLPTDAVDECRIIPAGAAADVDIIKTNVVTSTSVQTFNAADLNGTIGAGEISPARNITWTLNSHADWNATTATVEGLGEDGEEIIESFVIPDAGNVTLTGIKKFSKVTRVVLPAQAGTNGTATIGVGVDYGVMQGVLGVALQDPKKEQPATGSATGYADNDAVTILRRGTCAVWTETACEIGDEVYVRIVAGGAEVRGQFRRDMDGTLDAPDAIRVPGMHFAGRRTTAGIVKVELNLGV